MSSIYSRMSKRNHQWDYKEESQRMRNNNNDKKKKKKNNTEIKRQQNGNAANLNESFII